MKQSAGTKIFTATNNTDGGMEYTKRTALYS